MGERRFMRHQRKSKSQDWLYVLRRGEDSDEMSDSEIANMNTVLPKRQLNYINTDKDDKAKKLIKGNEVGMSLPDLKAIVQKGEKKRTVSERQTESELMCLKNIASLRIKLNREDNTGTIINNQYSDHEVVSTRTSNTYENSIPRNTHTKPLQSNKKSSKQRNLCARNPGKGSTTAALRDILELKDVNSDTNPMKHNLSISIPLVATDLYNLYEKETATCSNTIKYIPKPNAIDSKISRGEQTDDVCIVTDEDYEFTLFMKTIGVTINKVKELVKNEESKVIKIMTDNFTNTEAVDEPEAVNVPMKTVAPVEMDDNKYEENMIIDDDAVNRIVAFSDYNKSILRRNFIEIQQQNKIVVSGCELPTNLSKRTTIDLKDIDERAQANLVNINDGNNINDIHGNANMNIGQAPTDNITAKSDNMGSATVKIPIPKFITTNTFMSNANMITNNKTSAARSFVMSSNTDRATSVNMALSPNNNQMTTSNNITDNLSAYNNRVRSSILRTTLNNNVNINRMPAKTTANRYYRTATSGPNFENNLGQRNRQISTRSTPYQEIPFKETVIANKKNPEQNVQMQPMISNMESIHNTFSNDRKPDMPLQAQLGRMAQPAPAEMYPHQYMHPYYQMGYNVPRVSQEYGHLMQPAQYPQHSPHQNIAYVVPEWSWDNHTMPSARRWN